MERVVPCAIRLRYRRTSARGAAFIGRSLQPGRCAVGRRLYQHTSALRGAREDRLPGAACERDRSSDDDYDWIGTAMNPVSVRLGVGVWWRQGFEDVDGRMHDLSIVCN